MRVYLCRSCLSPHIVVGRSESSWRVGMERSPFVYAGVQVAISRLRHCRFRVPRDAESECDAVARDCETLSSEQHLRCTHGDTSLTHITQPALKITQRDEAV